MDDAVAVLVSAPDLVKAAICQTTLVPLAAFANFWRGRAERPLKEVVKKWFAMEADDQASWALEGAEPHDMHISWWPEFLRSDVAEVLKKAVGTTKTRLLTAPELQRADLYKTVCLTFGSNIEGIGWVL